VEVAVALLKLEILMAVVTVEMVHQLIILKEILQREQEAVAVVETIEPLLLMLLVVMVAVALEATVQQAQQDQQTLAVAVAVHHITIIVHLLLAVQVLL